MISKTKPIQPYWFLQQLVDEEVRRLAPDCPISPVVMYDDDKIDWDMESEGLGRVRWYVAYISPDGSARDLKPIFDAEIARWQQRYDLGLTCERIPRAA
jgi:hypothetical protein